MAFILSVPYMRVHHCSPGVVVKWCKVLAADTWPLMV